MGWLTGWTNHRWVSVAGRRKYWHIHRTTSCGLEPLRPQWKHWHASPAFLKAIYQFWEKGTQYTQTHCTVLLDFYESIDFCILFYWKFTFFKSGGCVKRVCQISGYYSRSSKRPNQSHISSSQLPLMAMKCALGVIRTIRPSTIPPCHNPIIQFTASLLDAKFGPKRSHDQKWKIKQGHTYGFHLKCSKFENINFCLFGLNKNQDQNCDKADKAFWNLEDMMLSHGCLGVGKMMGEQNERD